MLTLTPFLILSILVALALIGVFDLHGHYSTDAVSSATANEVVGDRRTLASAVTSGREVQHNLRQQQVLSSPPEYDVSDLSYIPKAKRLPSLSHDRPNNSLTYIYIAGVEGVGHHGVTPAIAAIARTCNEHVAYHDPVLKQAHINRNGTLFQHYLQYMQRADMANHARVTFIEDASLPTDNKLRNSTMAEKKNYSAYDLEWPLDELHKFGDVKVRYFYLSRDFYRTVNSHPEFDRTFERHGQVLYDYVQYIGAEYERINTKQPALWRHITYEWFTGLNNTAGCTALVSAIIDFAGWNDCDVEFACQMLNATLSRPRTRTHDTNTADQAYARRFNTTLPIPPLEIRSSGEVIESGSTSIPQGYTFRTAVSERVPFSYAENVTHRAQIRLQRMKLLTELLAAQRAGDGDYTKAGGTANPFLKAYHHLRGKKMRDFGKVWNATSYWWKGKGLRGSKTGAITGGNSSEPSLWPLNGKGP
jgi:hypothetical protein